MAKAPVTAIINVALSQLFGKQPKTLFQLLEQFTLTGDAKRTIVNALERRLQTQAARSMGKALGHTLTKQLDSVIDNPQLGQLNIEDQRRLSDGLAANIAIQLIKCAELITEYPAYQEVVVRCKEDGDAQDLAQARTHRDNAQDAIHTCLVNLGRIYAGQPVVPVAVVDGPDVDHVAGGFVGSSEDTDAAH